MNRTEALKLMEDWTTNPSLRNHMKSVEAAMVAYARHFGESENDWAVAGLLHDFDYERYPNDAHAADAEHPAEGVRHLRSLGVSDEICQAILGHAHYTGVARETRMAKTLFAVDELCGLITAAALVRPSKSVLDLEASSVKKRMKDKAFARGVSREDVILGAQELGVELEPHIAFVIEAMRARADEIGLRGTVAA
ncbi:HDIG domain-containing metalloprotein [Pseudogemmatithrix spongiicola]